MTILKNTFLRRTALGLLSGLFLVMPSSCWVYSFSGVSMPSNIKTVQVSYFPNDAPLINPLLSSYFTTQLQDLLLARTNLQLVKNNGDLIYEGEITRYNQTSVAPTIDPSTGKAVAGKVRLTIGVKVRYYNTKDEKQNVSQEFVQYADIEGTEIMSGAQEQYLVEQIVPLITEDILNSTVAQW